MFVYLRKCVSIVGGCGGVLVHLVEFWKDFPVKGFHRNFKDVYVFFIFGFWLTSLGLYCVGLTVDLAFALVCLILLVFTCFLQFGEILSEQVWIFQSKVQGLLFDFGNVIETDNGTDISMCWGLLILLGAKLWWFVMFQSGLMRLEGMLQARWFLPPGIEHNIVYII